MSQVSGLRGGVPCEVCGAREAKYRCPRCEARSCSLVCVRRHKSERQCSGWRNKAAFVALSSFTDRHLLSDYHFLEDVGRVTDSAHRELQMRGCGGTERGRGKGRGGRRTASRLQALARRRGTELLLSPQGMTRQKTNTSRVGGTRQQPVIVWRVELTFTEGDVLCHDQVPETELLSRVLAPYLHPTLSDPIIRHRLQSYRGVEGAEVLMKVERESAGAVRYHLLSKELSLKDNLSDKTLFDFPSFLVVPLSHLDRFPLHHSTPHPSPPHTSTEADHIPPPPHTTTEADLPPQNDVKPPPPHTDAKPPLPHHPPPHNDATPPPLHYPPPHAGIKPPPPRTDAKPPPPHQPRPHSSLGSLQLIADLYSDEESQSD